MSENVDRIKAAILKNVALIEPELIKDRRAAGSDLLTSKLVTEKK
jgi:hypothetical protein